MANYNVTITNGNGTQTMKKGTYSVSAVANGYDVSTLTPDTFTASENPTSQVFTLSATGTLTFNVNETGLVGGTPVTSGSIVMTDSSGNARYGEAVNIGSSGEAVFNNVPFGTQDTPFLLYFKQLTTDENHNIYESVITVNMVEENQVEYVQNTLLAEQTFTLNDATYGLPIDGTLNFNENN